MDDGDDTRVKDALPEATIEQLRAWFSLPSFQDLEEAGTQAAPPELSIQQKRQQEVERVLEHVKPHMMVRVERNAASGERWRPTPMARRAWETPERMIAVGETAVDQGPADFRAREIPRALINDLKICTPQSFLRDLFRPEKSFWIRMQPPWDDDVEPVMRDPMERIRNLLRASYRVVNLHTPSTTSIVTSRDERRAIMKRPWAESKREEARRREAELLRKEAEEKAVQRSPEGTR